MQAGAKGALSTEPEAAARSAPGAIEEIMVTARKRSEGGQSVPISISAFTGAELDEAQMRNLYAVAELTPNLEVRQVYIQARPAIYIRGIGTSDYGPEVASSVGVYQDGVYKALQTGMMFQTFDMDRTEVLRGPQGTLYGKNTTGGAINVHSVMPSDELGGYFQASYGNWKTNNWEGALNIPISEQLAARVAFARRKSDGYIKNHGPGHDNFNGDDNWGARALISYTPTENLDLLLNVHGGRIKTDWIYIQRGLFDPNDVTPRSFNFLEQNGVDFRPDGPANCPTSVFQGGCAEMQGYVAGGEKSLYDAQSPEPTDEEINLWGTSLTANYDMDTRWGPLTLTSITSYGASESSEWEDLDAGPVWTWHYRWDDFSYQFTQELRLASSGDSPLNWIVGAWYFESNIKTRADSYSPPDGIVGSDFGFRTIASGGDKFFTENYAFFGQLSYELTERLGVTAGLRYSWERKNSRQYGYNYTEYEEGFTEVGPDTAVAQGTPCGSDLDIHFDPANCAAGRDESNSWQAISGDLVLDYQLTDDVMLYASYRRGFKSGGFSSALDNPQRYGRLCSPTPGNDCSDPSVLPEATNPANVLNTTVDEEILQSYEAGFKSMWFDRRLRFNFSTFFYDYDDLQVFALTLIGGSIQAILENAADATIWGGEIDMMARPLPGLELRLAGSWLSTEYKDFISATAEGDLSGNEMIAAPNYSGSGSLAYELDVRDGVLRAQVGASYNDEVFYKADNDIRARQGAVWLVNGNLSYLLPDGRTQISVWIRNWGNKRYITNTFDIGGLGFDQTGSSRPRHYGATIRYAF